MYLGLCVLGVGAGKGMQRSVWACVLSVFMGVVSYGGAQPSGALALGMWEVRMNTWLTLMAHVVGRYLCPGALNCGSEEVCVPVCDGWAVNWDSCDCMVRF